MLWCGQVVSLLATPGILIMEIAVTPRKGLTGSPGISANIALRVASQSPTPWRRHFAIVVSTEEGKSLNVAIHLQTYLSLLTRSLNLAQPHRANSWNHSSAERIAVMRLRTNIVLLACIVFLTLTFFLSRLVSFIQIFFEHAGPAITQTEVVEAYASTTPPDSRPQHIPKLIHQVYHSWGSSSGGSDSNNGTEMIPADWEEVRQTCMELNKGWEFKLIWLIVTKAVDRGDIQRLPRGRVPVVPGDGCLENLTPLLYLPAFVADGGRGALSNNVLGSAPNHPFWVLLTSKLISYNYYYFFPYVTISYASGQWFETAIWEKYHRQRYRRRQNLNEGHGSEGQREGKRWQEIYRLMMDDRLDADPWVFFTQERGGTWVNWDNMMFLLVGEHLVFLAMGIVALVGLCVLGVVRCWGRMRREARREQRAREQRAKDESPRKKNKELEVMEDLLRL
ncbi:hypothetical protein B7463_g11526, partial [Scytalidium lignicola]